MKLALVIDPEDISFVPLLKPILAGHKVTVIQKCPEIAVELALEYEGIICAQEAFLHKILLRRGLIADYAGSLLYRAGKPFLVVPPIKQLVTVTYGDFLFRRYLSKILRPQLWQSEIPFEWEEVTTQERFNELYSLASSSYSVALSTDIETADEPLRIQICSYSIIYFTPEKHIRLCNFTFSIDAPHRFRWMKELNSLPLPKVFQNGIYDNSWFTYYGCVPQNWLFDTQDMFHSWYCELPKRLEFVTTFCVRESWAWKKESKTGVWQDFLRYGCLDVWGTSCSFLYMMEFMPTWAWENYLIKFPLNFPCLLTGYRGWKVDVERRDSVKEEQIPDIEDNRKLLATIVRRPNFNPGSWQQVKPVLQVLNTNPKLTVDSTDEKMREKIKTQHAINEFIVTALDEYKTAQKLVSSYLNAKLLHNRFCYQFAPSGSDTARFTCYPGAFWTGNSIQVIPRGPVIKQMFIADEGFYLAEPDAEQAEARCVAYLSGDENLIATVESPRDYHKTNAEKFFGIPYDEIQEDIRDLSKRTNHGANYNMGENVLLQTMGVRNVIKAQQLLKLPASWSLKQVCRHLLDTYESTYPDVKGAFYEYLISQVQAIHKVTSALGWTRYFFGEPWKKGHKSDVNALVAHVPQNLNVGIINESFLKLYEFEKKTNGDFQLRAQIHDSIPFQYRIGRLDLACEAARIMERPYKITDCKGKTRNMLIPIALKAEGTRWSELKKIPNYRDIH